MYVTGGRPLFQDSPPANFASLPLILIGTQSFVNSTPALTMQQGDAFHMDGYEALESIGSGSFGVIRKVRRKTDGKVTKGFLRIALSALHPGVRCFVHTPQKVSTTLLDTNLLFDYTGYQILARKEIDYRRMSQKEKEQLVSEVNILRDLKHPNIVEFLERVIDRENSFIYILMEYCEGGDLAAVIRRHREKKYVLQ